MKRKEYDMLDRNYQKRKQISLAVTGVLWLCWLVFFKQLLLYNKPLFVIMFLAGIISWIVFVHYVYKHQSHRHIIPQDD